MLIDSLHAPIALPPFERVITPDDVGGYPAWHTLVRQGALRHLYGDGAVPTAINDTAEMRAQTVAAYSPFDSATMDLALAGRSAAWVWVGGAAPTPMEYIQPAGRRNRDYPGHLVRTAIFDASQLVQICGIWVTNLERTIRDLAVWHDAGVALPLINALTELGANLGQAQLMLERQMRVVGRPAARQTLADASHAS